MLKLRICISMVAALALTSCATLNEAYTRAQQQPYYASPEAKMAAEAVGHKIETVAASWGTPFKITQIGAESHATWLYGRMSTATANSSTNATVSGNFVRGTTTTQIIPAEFVGCEVVLRVDGSTNTVIGYQLVPHYSPQSRGLFDGPALSAEANNHCR